MVPDARSGVTSAIQMGASSATVIVDDLGMTALPAPYASEAESGMTVCRP